MSARSDLVASLVTFHVRLWLGGLVAAVLVPVSLVAAFANFVAGRAPNEGPYADVHARADAVNAWLKALGTPDARRGAVSSIARQSPDDDVRESASVPRARASA